MITISQKWGTFFHLSLWSLSKKDEQRSSSHPHTSGWFFESCGFYTTHYQLLLEIIRLTFWVCVVKTSLKSVLWSSVREIISHLSITYSANSRSRRKKQLKMVFANIKLLDVCIFLTTCNLFCLLNKNEKKKDPSMLYYVVIPVL